MSTVHTRSDPTSDAERLLAEVWGERIPVDPVLIARSLGIRVLNAPLDDNVSGAIVKESGKDPSIFLNQADSPNRRRFTCAHEIGHFVKRSDAPDEYDYVDYRDALSSTGLKEDERYANSFAAALLMPEKEVRRLHAEGLSDIEMSARFGVSLEAMQYRLRNLGLV